MAEKPIIICDKCESRDIEVKIDDVNLDNTKKMSEVSISDVVEINIAENPFLIAGDRTVPVSNMCMTIACNPKKMILLCKNCGFRIEKTE